MTKADRRSREDLISADEMMRKLAQSLILDFQENLGDPSFCSRLLPEYRNGAVEGIRQGEPTVDYTLDDPARFKAVYQMASIVKRYRFETDLHSDSDLELKAIASFRDTQNRLATLDLDTVPTSTHRVLDIAASYIAKVLGKYDDEECRALCRFGKRASVGIPARKASEAARWELPISGSLEQITWFDSEMSQVDDVQEYWCRQLDSDPNRSNYQVTSSLKLTLVPKTFKSLRSIMPNTTIGSYMSFGLGEIMRKRLRREGYDIRRLQMRHRSLAQSASKHNLLVTADLSSASDSISVALVNRLFPADWCEILHRSRIGTVNLPDGSSVESKTFCTMGIGYTFPLQTLVFLALLKAIERTMFHPLDRRTISVYGDDLIYSSRMHDEVLFQFGQVGFVINVDKTFCDGSFRESCGGDYFRGVDVRPFQPRNGSAFVGKRAYEAMLYKYINGLLMRWDEHEIGITLNYLVTELEKVTGKAKIVPDQFPDDSGIKCPSLSYWDFLQYANVAQPKHLGSGLYRFAYLRLLSEKRKEARHEPYLWLALRGSDRSSDLYDGRNDYQEPQSVSKTVRRISLLTGTDCRTPLLITEEEKPIVTFRSKIRNCRLRRSHTYVTVSHTGSYSRQSGISCFENRR